MPGSRHDERREVDESKIEAILGGIGAGDRNARESLFAHYRPRLDAIVRARLGKRSPRALVDASDIVQKAMAVAAKRLDDFIARRPMPVFPWLYALTRDQLGKAQRKLRVSVSVGLADESANRIASILADSGTTPSGNAARNEARRMVHDAVMQVKPEHREILIMRYNEGLKLTEIAAILRIGESAARMRHLRALEEMKGLVGDWSREAEG
jgi:RNA polymerase sigma-70 factor (ECF subfamily)